MYNQARKALGLDFDEVELGFGYRPCNAFLRRRRKNIQIDRLRFSGKYPALEA